MGTGMDTTGRSKEVWIQREGSMETTEVFGYNGKGYGYNGKGYGYNRKGYGYNGKGYGHNGKVVWIQ